MSAWRELSGQQHSAKCWPDFTYYIFCVKTAPIFFNQSQASKQGQEAFIHTNGEKKRCCVDQKKGQEMLFFYISRI